VRARGVARREWAHLVHKKSRLVPEHATLYLDSGQITVGCAGDPARRLLRVVSVGTLVTDPVSDGSDQPAL
jgi:hypothetical protein